MELFALVFCTVVCSGVCTVIRSVDHVTIVDIANLKESEKFS